MLPATLLPSPAPAPGAVAARPAIDVVVPVFNEQRVLAARSGACTTTSPSTCPSPGASSSPTTRAPTPRRAIAAALAADLPGVARRCDLAQKGRGRALRAAWSASDADGRRLHGRRPLDGPRALLPLVAPLVSGPQRRRDRHAAGARLARRARRPSASSSRAPTTACCTRRCGARFSDAQCGFKAVRADVARRLLPAGARRRLVLRHRAAGARPARGPAHPRGAGRLGRRPGLARRHRAHRARRTCAASPGCSRRARLTRFLAVGVVSTLAYALLFLAAARRRSAPAGANARRARGHRRRQHRRPTGASRSASAAAHGLAAPARAWARVVYVLTLGLTTGALAVLQRLDPRPVARRSSSRVLVVAERRRDRHPLRRAARWVFARAGAPAPLRRLAMALDRADA